MATAPSPAEVFRQAAEEGRRRLDQSLLELVATAFIAGFTIVFGIAGLGIVHSLAEPLVGEFARVLGALAFGLGVVFLVVGRAELFSENFFDPIAAGFERHRPHLISRLARLWSVTLLLNLVGGAALVLVLSCEGALPLAAEESLSTMAAEIAGRSPLATFMRAIIGGALIALLSFLVIAAGSNTGRILLAYAVGVLLALGPFDHVVVSILHLIFGLGSGALDGPLKIAEVAAIAIAGNLVGGVGLVTLSHAAQAKGSESGRPPS